MNTLEPDAQRFLSSIPSDLPSPTVYPFLDGEAGFHWYTGTADEGVQARFFSNLTVVAAARRGKIFWRIVKDGSVSIMQTADPLHPESLFDAVRKAFA